MCQLLQFTWVNLCDLKKRTLVQLCRQYFRLYDFNQNSFLDVAELVALARDLSDKLDVPMKSQAQLREAIDKFSSDGSDCLTFEEFTLWFATMIGLEEPMMTEIQHMASQE